MEVKIYKLKILNFLKIMDFSKMIFFTFISRFWEKFKTFWFFFWSTYVLDVYIISTPVLIWSRFYKTYDLHYYTYVPRKYRHIFLFFRKVKNIKYFAKKNSKFSNLFFTPTFCSKYIFVRLMEDRSDANKHKNLTK